MYVDYGNTACKGFVTQHFIFQHDNGFIHLFNQSIIQVRNKSASPEQQKLTHPFSLAKTTTALAGQQSTKTRNNSNQGLHNTTDKTTAETLYLINSYKMLTEKFKPYT